MGWPAPLGSDRLRSTIVWTPARRGGDGTTPRRAFDEAGPAMADDPSHQADAACGMLRVPGNPGAVQFN